MDKNLILNLKEVVSKGKIIFEKIKQKSEKYKSKCAYFLLPCQSVENLNSYIKYINKFKSISDKEAILIVDNNIDLDFEYIIKIKEEEIITLIKYYSIFNFHDDFHILSLNLPYSTHAENLIGYKDTVIDEILYYDVFKIDKIVSEG